MSRVILSDLSENKVVLPTNVSTFDRNRQRSVVFYGRVSTEHEAQLAALENQMQWYEDQAKYITINRTAGLDMVYFDEDITAKQVLIDYYTQEERL